MLKVQQLLHICSEHYEAKEKEKEEDKDKKDKKDKDKKETAADMGSHQVRTKLLPLITFPLSAILLILVKFCFMKEKKIKMVVFPVLLPGCSCSWYRPYRHGGGDWF